MTSVAAKASARLDSVIVGTLCPQIELPKGTFDCIVLNEVLEHMVAPEQALRSANSTIGRRFDCGLQQLR